MAVHDRHGESNCLSMIMNNTQNGIGYSLDLFDNKRNIPSNHAAPCSVLFNNAEVGGIFITCSPQDMKYFNISNILPHQPNINFRMLDSGKNIYVLEIWLLFEQLNSRALKLHLNPHDSNVNQLFKIIIKTRMIAFHFYNKDSKLIYSVMTDVDDREFDWFKRNYRLIKKLGSDKQGYLALSNRCAKEYSKTDRRYNYYDPLQSDFFVKKDDPLMITWDIAKLK
jgi:hypothetical protein